MNWLSRLRGRIAVDRDLREEIAQHLQERADELVREGLQAEEAFRQARREFGNATQIAENGRDVWRLVVIENLWADLRYAVRQLRRSPAFATAAILTLALGIGATAAMYSAIDAVFFRSLPFAQPDRLVRVQLGVPVEMTAGRAPKFANITDLFAMRDVFSHVAAYASGGLNLGTGDQPVRVAATFVTADFFSTIGRVPLIGRLFSPQETARGGPPALLLSYGVWRSQFGADPAITGRAVILNGVSHDVIGVMARDFHFPGDVWVPLPVPVPDAVLSAFRNSVPSITIARLAPGVTLETARKRVDLLQRQYLRPGRRAASAVAVVVPLRQSFQGDRKNVLSVLMASAALVLLIACANVANLLLSRAAVREREIGMRLAMGATRGRIFQQLLVEHLTLAAVGAVLGLAAAMGTLPALSGLVPPSLTPFAPLRVDWRVFGFTLVATLVTGLAFGLWPAVRSSRAALIDALKRGGGAGPGHTSGRRLTRALVIAEAALACLLLIESGLMLASLNALLSTELGMRVETVATARLNLPDARYATARDLSALVQGVLAALSDTPGVAHAAAINTLPFSREGGISLRVSAEGTAIEMTERPMAPYLVVSPGYFQTMGMRLLGGRDLSWTDHDKRPVAAINQRLAEALWPGEDALGKRFTMAGPMLRTVVGVVENARIAGLTVAAGPQVYIPIQDQPQSYVSIVARGIGAAAPDTLIPHIRSAVFALDPALPIYAAQPMETVVSATEAPRRTQTVLITVFGAVALCLAGIGLYAMLAYAVAQRTREIGLRVALGAGGADVVRMVVRQGFALCGIGVVIGLACALVLAPAVESLLFGVSTRDPFIYGQPAQPATRPSARRRPTSPRRRLTT